MIRLISRIFRFLIFIFLIESRGETALAVLGEDQNSVESDRRSISGERAPSKEKIGYHVETLKSPAMTLEEYVDAKGTIFAVSWEGEGIPDLAKLFGRYFGEFQRGLTERRKDPRLRRVPIIMKTDHLVVETGGRRKVLRGRAYVPSLLPDGVTEKEIR